MTHAENDEDKRAIACLERAVEQVCVCILRVWMRVHAPYTE